MKFKRFIAFAVVATMVAGSTLTAFAADEGVTGQGAVEYDDSTAIKYDKVQVPTLTADTYNFKMDPTGMISNYGGDGDETFEAGKYVFFHAVQNRAYIEAAAVGVKYKETYAVVTPESDQSYKIAGWLTGTFNDDDELQSYTVASGKYLWVPDAEYSGGSGSSGKYVEVTNSNIDKFFKVEGYDDSGTNKVKATFLSNCKAAPDVCDGKLYNKTYTSIGDGVNADAENSVAGTNAKIVDADDAPLSDYVTVSNEGAITAIKGLYKEGDEAGTYVACVASDFEYTEPTTRYQSTSDNVYVKNLSTKDKTVTAKVTLKDATGLTINSSNSFTANADKAAIYVGVYDAAKQGGAGYTALASGDGGVITATVTVPLAAAVDNGETTYQTTELNKLGGHKYKRFSGPTPTYTSNYFNIEAAINPAGDDKDASVYKAWVKYFEDAEKAPSLNIVYSVKNTNEEDNEEEEETPAAPSIATKTYTYTSGQALEIPVSLGSGALAATGINRITYINSSGVSTALATTNWSYANGKITIAESYITALAGANVTRDYKVTFDGEAGTATQVTITLKP